MKRFARYSTRIFPTLRAHAAILCAALAAMLCGSIAFAQSGAGSIQGTVSDPSGAVIPNASVHVLNQATGVRTNAKSNGVGFYQVPGLFAGTYTITVTAPGMKTYNRTIQLLAAQNAVINTAMSTGAVTQQVQVTADAVQLTTPDSGVISSTLENQRINQLPMNGRNLISLVQETTPGLESCSQSSSCPNGLFGEAMEYVADGASLANREFGGTHTGSAEMPDPDSVQEVHVETTGSGAQYATPATAVLNTKSGTNALHGTLFETARNNAFGISRQRQNPSSFVAPPYVRNEFGASAGGPIIIPHLYHGKNKSFWFFSYERYSLRSFSYENMKVPTTAMRQGDFSGLVNSSGLLQQLYDPATTIASADCNGSGSANQWCRTPFANNYIDPATRESPDAKIFNDITALPSNSNNPLVTTNLAGKKISNVTAPTITFRLDHEFNENNRAYLRYTSEPTDNVFNRDDPSAAQPTLAADGLPYAASNLSIDLTSLFAGAVGYTHIFSPTFFSETVISQSWFGEYNAAGGTPGHNFEKDLGLPNNFGEPGFPWIGSSHIISPMQGTMFQYGVSSIISDIDENLTKTVGRHQVLFGARYRHERFGSRPDESKDGIDFNGNGTGLEDPTSGSNYKNSPNSGFADADEFIGNAASYSVNIEPPYQHLHDMEFDAYIQDNYRVRNNLTLNIGLRYEAHPALWSKYGMMSSFDLKNDAVVLAAPPDKLIAEGLTTQAVIDNAKNNFVKFETPQEAGMPANTLTNNSNFTFGPRVGIAWLPFGSSGTVLRGAYGRYIYPEPIRSYAINMNKAMPFTANYAMNYNAANQAPDSLANYQLRSPQTVFMGKNSTDVIDSTTTHSILPGYSIYALDPDYPPNYVTQTNFTVEQPMPGNSVLRVSYLYTHASNLDQNYLYNQHYSDFAWEVATGTKKPSGSTIGQPDYAATGEGVYDQITYGGGSWMQLKSGWSNDNILQVNYQRLFHHGLAYQIDYGWEKPMRAGGNGGRDSNIYPSQVYLNTGIGTVSPVANGAGTGLAPAPVPARPAGIASYAFYRALNRYENYREDTGIPLQHIQFNGIVDLPFGKGKRYLSGANRALDELVGGWQFAGAGRVTSQDFSVNNSNWGPTNPIHIYKHGAKITDCRSGNCYKAYEWFNGYIPSSAISGNPCAGSNTKVVSGLPSGWLPSQSPIDTVCGDKYYGDNDVNVTLSNGSVLKAVSYAPSPSGNYSGNPYAHTVLNGPFYWSADLSLFKVFPITERTNLRFNMDAFNAFNVQGLKNPGSTDGVQQVTPGGVGASSANGPRELQLTLRLTF
ncbi:MAG TPA: carboxypeptidase-like regulatory domain-containing protein [Terracidiphilus sp.]|nr:carboxypeptidase-like regulatory domain-containing protein [Terracidiphilus sp.]